MIKIMTYIGLMLVLSSNIFAAPKCDTKFMEKSILDIYSKGFYELHGISLSSLSWLFKEATYKVKPYRNNNSYFGKNKHVCSSVFNVVTQSGNDLRDHVFEVGFSIYFNGKKDSENRDLFDSRVDFTKQIY